MTQVLIFYSLVPSFPYGVSKNMLDGPLSVLILEATRMSFSEWTVAPGRTDFESYLCEFFRAVSSSGQLVQPQGALRRTLSADPVCAPRPPDAERINRGKPRAQPPRRMHLK